MTNDALKPCRRCCEPIALAAQRCPKCQSWLSLWAWVAGNPQGWVSLPFALIAVVPLYWIFDRGADFARYRDQIEVVEPKLQADRGRGLLTIGRIKNNSPMKWTEVVIEVQYFDKDGKLIGAHSERNRSMVLLPKSEHAFEVSATMNQPAESYASQKVLIRDARDGSRWP